MEPPPGERVTERVPVHPGPARAACWSGRPPGPTRVGRGEPVTLAARHARRGRTAPLSAPPPRARHADHRVPAGPEGTDSCVNPGPSAPRPALTPPGAGTGARGEAAERALGKRGWVVAGPSSGATASPEGCGRVTLRDVAALAGVSVSPVSSVVHARVSVREQTRRRVREAAGQLGCRPNPAARRLRSGRSRMIGPALPSVTVPYVRDLADAVLRGAGDRGLSVLMTQTHGDVRRERGVRDDPYLRHVDGILLAPVARRPSPVARRPRRRGGHGAVRGETAGRGGLVVRCPTRAFASTPAPSRLPAPYSPTWSREAGDGIAALAPRGEARPAESDVRCQGHVAGLRDAGPPVRPERVVRTERVTFASGAAAARALLGQTPDTDAVFALGDALAPGALRGLHDAGRVVPDDTAWPGSPTWPRRRSAPRPHHGRPGPRGTGRACRVAPRRTHPGAGGRVCPCLPPGTTPSDSASPNGSRVVSQRSEQAPAGCDLLGWCRWW
ncbi:LacI family DNA-binding transcriptional regulator [Streptomyces olivaceus]|uniref:LacI family DNA-binding transcriptional regulator n=1 Tax=Streptomyces olivaceus TaxID=47716 RepID=UPI00331F46A4